MEDEVWRIIFDGTHVPLHPYVQQHLQRCSTCNNVYGPFLKLNQDLAGLLTEKVPEGFDKRFLFRLRERQREISLRFLDKILLHLSNAYIRVILIILFNALLLTVMNPDIGTSLEELTANNLNNTSIFSTIGILAFIGTILSVLKLAQYQQ
jgi:predicted anti-sigma-YlaC factor YlaD